MKVDFIDKADTEISIEKVLMDFFGISSVEDAGGWKTHCPLGSEHSDGGVSKAMRVYSDSNSAWCFSHSLRFTPVSLWQLATGEESKTQAAKDLLENYGIGTTPPTLDERWDKLETKKEPEFSVKDMESIKEALFFFARNSLPGYEVLQYEDVVLQTMHRILITLEHLDESSNSATMEEWLEKAKNVLEVVWRNNGWN